MLFLMFRIGRDRYVLDVDAVEQVLPLMDAKVLPGVPAGVVGAINYRGAPVPLIDLGRLALGRDCAPVMSTRIILVRYPDGTGGSHRLALCAERVVETIARPPEAFVATGVEAGTPGYLGPVLADAGGLIQWVRVEALLSPELREVLFRTGEVA
ncbi:chemotaxis protein CheW [Ancylobacter sp. 6x-1]|uniref:Chemotaxis protein CheW n=1 Tax=Ancylobacter crimeensis TaxID=2579147 RepID=A0ABT0D8Z4_9HYPH|nr:chemotaxis protein CheW [Ancylobacter crimeensis]MCK0196421.1 chemotaxis protein CheW [Ancylobacter crimeensis]